MKMPPTASLLRDRARCRRFRRRDPPGPAGTVPSGMEGDAPEETPAPEPEPEAAPAPAGPPPADDGGGRLSVRLLVIALVGQLILFGGLIALTVHGFPFFGGGDHDDDPVATSLLAGKVPTPKTDRFDARA